MLREIKIFLAALMFFTRIPCPSFKDFDESWLNSATRYFSLIGIIVGSLQFLAYYACSHIFSIEVSVTISLLAGVIITGAFHEDGLADAIDGFGGGYTPERILEIMKDSRIGAFGVIGLILFFLLKFTLLCQLMTYSNTLEAFAIFLIFNSLSRAAAGTIIACTSYCRNDLTSKVKPLATAINTLSLSILILVGLAPVYLFGNMAFLSLILPLILCVSFLRRYMLKKIGGFTGDCLGATQQVCEIVILFSIPVIRYFL
jgi:adenosylcobinamide-GDP ribazoletransferase